MIKVFSTISHPASLFLFFTWHPWDGIASTALLTDKWNSVIRNFDSHRTSVMHCPQVTLEGNGLKLWKGVWLYNVSLVLCDVSILTVNSWIILDILSSIIFFPSINRSTLPVDRVNHKYVFIYLPSTRNWQLPIAVDQSFGLPRDSDENLLWSFGLNIIATFRAYKSQSRTDKVCF